MSNPPCSCALRGLFLVLAFALVVGCRARDTSPTTTPATNPPAGRVREPAVAGLFYPKDRAALEQLVDRLLAGAPEQKISRLRALVCPHAGYAYSGPTAAASYKLLKEGSFDTVILLAPSHYAAFRGASVSSAEAFRTPLGLVPISGKTKGLAGRPPFVLEPRCLVQRPSWSQVSSRPLPAAGEDTPDTWEHSDEVQVPFLQRTLKDFKLLPIVCGEVDAEEVARGLAPLLEEKTSDFGGLNEPPYRTCVSPGL